MRFWFAAAAALLAVAGCSSSTTAGKATTSPARSSGGFLAAVRPLYPSTNTDADLLKLGHDDCAVLASGSSAADLVDRLGGTSLDARRATTKKTVTAAIQYLCPAYRSSLPIGD